MPQLIVCGVNAGVQTMLSGLDLDSFTEPQLLRYMKQLERERNALYNELRDIEWKLDQESKLGRGGSHTFKLLKTLKDGKQVAPRVQSFHKYNDIRKTYMTEITDAMLNLEAMRSRLKFLDLGDDIAKCPRHLKYLNIQPDHRVLDPKKGPIKKTAAVRSLPKLGTSEEDRKESKEEVEEVDAPAEVSAETEEETVEEPKKKEKGEKKEK
ncbi:CCDC169 [Cordylochernes scorpioides]|uniref:CCDC169 n=1 Tax=Cordylochernes scorpioides TaxID=51811 RepID=A0ABY6LRZ5_9ARAC|nr:CCDC169 [Cordylochernes scorpioides]